MKFIEVTLAHASSNGRYIKIAIPIHTITQIETLHGSESENYSGCKVNGLEVSESYNKIMAAIKENT